MGQKRLSEAIERLEHTPFPEYVAEGREWLYDQDLKIALAAAKQQEARTP